MFLSGDMKLPSSSSPKVYLSLYGRLGEMLAMYGNASKLAMYGNATKLDMYGNASYVKCFYANGNARYVWKC